MSFLSARLEDIKIPENIEELLQTGEDWKQELDETLSVWARRDEEGFLGYRLVFNLKSEEARGYRPYLEEWARAGGVREKQFNHRMARYLAGYIDGEALPAPAGWYDKMVDAPKAIETSLSIGLTGQREDFLHVVCKRAFAGLRALGRQRLAELQAAHSRALEDENALESYGQMLRDNQTLAADYEQLFEDIAALMAARGLTDETLELLLWAAFLPRKDVAEDLEKLAQRLGLPALLDQDRQHKERLFLALQQRAKAYYLSLLQGYATQADVQRVARRLAAVLAALGYGIQPDALVCIIRTFENDVVMGIGLQWYEANEGYSPEDFGYYDSQGSEELYYDSFWEKLDIMQLIGETE